MKSPPKTSKNRRQEHGLLVILAQSPHAAFWLFFLHFDWIIDHSRSCIHANKSNELYFCAAGSGGW